jgi:regulator of protease activity HflC (stomatin/prohibitin superfamily)|tara:strand:+ start:184 stop:1092 length:909 start_codon:yes stop_codon:yes gene_type:complete
MLTTFITLLIVFITLLTLYLGIKIVRQSEVLVIERLGKYSKTLYAGLSIIVPYIERVAHRVSILERQLAKQEISVITRDNVEVKLETIVFYRVTDAANSVYRIRNVDDALKNAASSIVRSAAGKLELDELQSSRDAMNAEIATNISKAAEIWGIEITRTEITDVIIDDATKEAQRQQLNAERTKRATIATAEGEKVSIQLKADAALYEASKQADAVKLTADADAYAVKVKADADAEQTKLLAEAIAGNGKVAVDFEIAKRQVSAIGELASSSNSKTLILPSEMTQVFSAAYSFLENLPKKEK